MNAQERQDLLDLLDRWEPGEDVDDDATIEEALRGFLTESKA